MTRKFISDNAIPPVKHERTVKIRVGLIEALLRDARYLGNAGYTELRKEGWNETVQLFATELARLYPRSFKHDEFIAECGGLFWEMENGE